MNITPVSFGKAIKVVTNKDGSAGISRMASLLKDQAGRSENEWEVINDLLDIFEPSTRYPMCSGPDAPTFVWSGDNEGYVFTEKEAKVARGIEKSFKKKLENAPRNEWSKIIDEERKALTEYGDSVKSKGYIKTEYSETIGSPRGELVSVEYIV